jgi:NAD(P)-dependent dehydrogenase (short-subunit alcohol dehydrogenase family)
VAEQANRLGPFDAVIHNAAVGYREPRIQTEDGLPHVFAVNVLSFYVLTALVDRPKRLVYLSSGMHRGADASLEDVSGRSDAGGCFGVRQSSSATCSWPSPWLGGGQRLLNAVDPDGSRRRWAAGRPRRLDEGYRTQRGSRSATIPRARLRKYFHHRRPQQADPAAHDAGRQEKLLDICRRLSGVALDAGP